MGFFSNNAKAAASSTYKCSKCGFTKTKTGMLRGIAPKCPKCGKKMELVSSTD